MSRDRGAKALVVAAVFLLTAAWCYFLSPVAPWMDDVGFTSLHIEGLGSAERTFFFEKGQTFRISLQPFEEPVRFDVRLFDPNGKLIWQKQNTTWARIEFKALKTGTYTIEVKNLGEEEGRLSCNYRSQVYVRPAAALAPWLVLISLPVLAYGIWVAIRRKE